MQEFDYPPGVSAARPNLDDDHRHFHGHSGSLAGYGSSDRGLSSATSYGSFGVHAFAPPHSTMPRSMGFQERDFAMPSTDSWPSAPNTNRLASAAPHLSHTIHPLPPHHPSASPSLQLASGNPAGITIDNGAYPVSGRALPSLPSAYKDRDTFISRGSISTPNQTTFTHAPLPSNPLSPTSPSSRSTLWWGELEPWMDEEYAKQVCGLMGWDPVNVKVPHPAPDPITGQQANNPGYCFLTFPTPTHAASVLAQINNSNPNNPITMPNSTKPFLLNWASSTPIPPSLSPPGVAAQQQQQYPKEYSIFVGDLAPEASNSDLVAVFRNPVLGLRNDREPKFIRPFLSCKSAKIMLDPVTGVSRGYGFVRCAHPFQSCIRTRVHCDLCQLHR